MCGKKFCNYFSLKVGKQFRKKTRNFLKEYNILICRVEILLKFINPKRKRKTVIGSQDTTTQREEK
jgi:hypothetical protein